MLIDLNNIDAKEIAAILPENVILEQAAAYMAQNLKKGEALTSPDKARELVRTLLFNKERETFIVLLLDTQNRYIDHEVLFEGTIDQASVYPREVVKYALDYNAKAVFLAHNHPSGKAEESAADKRITRLICDALSLIDVNVLDHFIVGTQSDEILSFAEKGWL
ncbi:DNA repair protein RadC [Photobacterium sp. ZSDE20]|uniref:DNA repair protein RadC n=1 Tax=Photobacterium pectinilyticum TaxID=2906793 RepID=A0ABT1N8X5_9GAMM|nr:DNA repair protein RadC [Photobacterium sp. ZSDE20]MCQ1060284.1 DNA repair protein RadC [Photobacterium sp. ZSDE20]MDD1826271.1 DNA repair protein RadC [Photobacterium sp. ZSDE20]